MGLVKGLLDLFNWFNWLSDRSQKIKTTLPLAAPSLVSPQKKSLPTSERDPKRIVPSHEDLKDIPPIRYTYDPVPVVASYLSPVPVSFPSRASQSCCHLSHNSTRIYPLSGGLPYRSSLDYVRGCKHFQANFLESVAVLESIVAENSIADIPVGRAGITLAGLAQNELRPGIADRMALATVYMFPAADEKRLRIIATMMILYFIFDDKVEETPNGALLNDFRKDFFSHLRDPSCFVGEPIGNLQRHTRATMKALWAEDSISGNGGREMVEALRDAFRCVHPEGDFQSIEAYLQFRRLNVGARFVIAAAKFSIRSSVDVADPRFARYLSLISDHYGIINDMASFEKEAKALKHGDTHDMINIVSVIQKSLSMPTGEAAKVASFSYQLQVESWIMEEIELLARNGDLTDEEWWFLEVVFLTATGNTFFCMTSARYGGQAALIDAAW